MIDHFSIAVPKNERSELERELVRHVERDPKIVILRGNKAGLGLAFSLSPESADFERRRFREVGSISPSICFLMLNEYGIQVNQECSDSSRRHMAEVVRWTLTNFRSARVYDDDTQEEITDAALADPGILFD